MKTLKEERADALRLSKLSQNVLALEAREEELNWKTAFLEAQVNASIDGILVVDQHAKRILQNGRVAELFKVPGEIFDSNDDEELLRWVAHMTRFPAEFVEKVQYLYSHPHEIGRDEIELKDGTVIDRYSSPVLGKDGKYYGRIWTFRDITERTRAAENLRLLGAAVAQSNESIVITDAALDMPGPKIIFVNPAFTRMTGFTAEDAIGATPRLLQGPRTELAVTSRLRATLARGEPFEGEAINYRKDGSEFTMEWQVAPISNGRGALTHFVAIQRDITSRKQLERQLLQAQKLETAGKLAGGVAHEFNSILTAILGQSELLLVELAAESPLAGKVTEINKAAGRAAALTQQLLAYGRKQLLQPEVLDLNHLLGEMEGLLQRLAGGGVDLQIAPAYGVQTVKADARQIEQVIMNMVINARDAMPGGGRITLATATHSMDEPAPAELKPGDYATLTITDTGEGLSEEAKARVFEPFFSARNSGEGVSLGLSTCYGIIKQSGGNITVASEAGRGSAFKIYLPQVMAQSNPQAQRLDSPGLPRGAENILLVEPDPALREMAVNLLCRLGYAVLAAGDGVEALTLQGGRPLDLLLTGLAMPRMNGRDLARQIRAGHPGVKFLFTLACSEHAAEGVRRQDGATLQKPFTPSALAKKLREVLDQPLLS